MNNPEDSDKAPFWDRLKSVKLFSEKEAWGLFRLAAIGEAVGWTMLIAGIIIRHYGWIGHDLAVPIAGSLHGMLFLAYFGILLATFSSLDWPLWKLAAAALAGVPPYGSLVFEQLAAHSRRGRIRGSYRRIMVRAVIVDRGLLLAAQPADGVTYNAPGGYIARGESPESAGARILLDLTGVTATVGPLLWMMPSKRHPGELELFFSISNAQDFRTVDFSKAACHAALDDLRFIGPGNASDLESDFLRTTWSKRSERTAPNAK
jgi:integral membrane protein